MKTLKWIGGIVLVLAVIVIAGGLMLPGKFTVKRSVEMAAPVDKVFALVEDPRQWARWTVWNRRDPAMQMSYGGPPNGAGASWSWKSATEGSGNMSFTATEPGRLVAYELNFPEFDTTSRGDLRFESAGSGTRVTWTMHGDMGANPVFRWLALFMDRMVGPDFEGGLNNLKAEAEKA